MPWLPKKGSGDNTSAAQGRNTDDAGDADLIDRTQQLSLPTFSVPAKSLTGGSTSSASTSSSSGGGIIEGNGGSTSNGRSSLSPAFKHLGKLRVQVIGAHDLIGKDRSGLSDPFIVISLPGAPPTATSAKKDRNYYRRVTPVRPKTLEPTWNETEATFEWDITSDWLPHAQQHRSPSADSFGGNAESGGLLSAPNATNNAPITESPMMEVEDPIAAHVSAGDSQKPASLEPNAAARPSNVRKISAVTGKILVAPVKITAKGAVATTRAVRKKGRPRPIRLRRGNNSGRTGSADVATLTQASTASTVSAIEFVVWDKDKWSGNDYMGECSVPVSEWLGGAESARWEASRPISVPLSSSRRHTKVSGEIKVKIGIVGASPQDVDTLYNALLTASTSHDAANIRSIPADQSVGTAGPTEAFLDDGLSSGSESEAREELLSEDEQSDSDSDSEDYDGGTTELEELSEADEGTSGVRIVTGQDDDDTTMPQDQEDSQPAAKARRRLLPRRLTRTSPAHNDTTTSLTSISTSDTGEEASSTNTGAHKTTRSRYKVRRKRQTQEKQSSGEAPLDGAEGEDSKASRQGRRKRRTTLRKKRELAFKTELGMDIIGIVQMEVKGAQDLPRWKNSLGTGFDMDAFVILSFGHRIFRTRVARHTLNPTWDEKLLFHVRRHEANFVTKLAIYDWDKLTSHDFVGSAQLAVAGLIDAAPKPDPTTGLYSANDEVVRDMVPFHLPLTRPDAAEEHKTLGKHAPILTVEAKFVPYSLLRQRFWRQILTQYDTNDSGTISRLELMSMLDSLGSTLTSKTIEGMFSHVQVEGGDHDELTIDAAIIALEAEIAKPYSEKRYVDKGGWEGPTPSGSGSQTPAVGGIATGDLLSGDGAMDYSGPDAPTDAESGLADKKIPVPTSVLDGVPAQSNEKSSRPLIANALQSEPEPAAAASASQSPAYRHSKQVERVIVLKSCPLCHMPRLSKKAEVDIVTHLAVCASQDWRRVDSMVVSNFVTASQAHRKWYTKVFSKISQGQYQVGADSANIIVQDRMTGELIEEKMQVYVRLGIRLLYKGARSRMEGARVRRMLKNMSVKQGRKFDSPASAREIPQFIAFHNLNLEEIRDPLESYKTFNQFFYRKLKEGVRPIADPDDPSTLVSSADCRLMAFSSITEATKVWIKGREFTVARLLGEEKASLSKFEGGGSLVIFRLAPQDYHRFHCPADARVEEIKMIQGQYYTVNPMAIRSAIDVYGENVRAVVRFHSEQFGPFYCVCIGAMMVGSINLSVKEGDQVKRGDELGYYAFGGSTNVCIFEEGRVNLDEDLLSNSQKATETLVRVGMRIGKASEAAAGTNQ